MGATAPDSVKRLVDHFDQNRKVFLSSDYKEEPLRFEFLNLFFTAPGWDMGRRKRGDPVRRQFIGGRWQFPSL